MAAVLTFALTGCSLEELLPGCDVPTVDQVLAGDRPSPEYYDHVLVATVTRFVPSTDEDARGFDIDIETVHVGEINHAVFVHVPPDQENLLVSGERYLIVAHRSSLRRLETDACSGTQPLPSDS